MSTHRARLRGWSRLGAIGVVLAMAGGTPSFASHLNVSGSAEGRVMVYFHQTQKDERGTTNPLCRRQLQEETAGFAWLDKYAYDPEGPLTRPNSPSFSGAYQRPEWRQAQFPVGDGVKAFEYKGTYSIGGVTFSGKLTTTLRAITYNGPSGSFAGPECTEPGPAPVIDAFVSGPKDEQGDELSCRYYDGVWQRAGPAPRIVLHGTCTIKPATGPAVTAAVRETRILSPSGDCQSVRPGTGMFGVGDCHYAMSVSVADDH